MFFPKMCIIMHRMQFLRQPLEKHKKIPEKSVAEIPGNFQIISKFSLYRNLKLSNSLFSNDFDSRFPESTSSGIVHFSYTATSP